MKRLLCDMKSLLCDMKRLLCDMKRRSFDIETHHHDMKRHHVETKRHSFDPEKGTSQCLVVPQPRGLLKPADDGDAIALRVPGDVNLPVRVRCTGHCEDVCRKLDRLRLRHD